MRRILIFLLLLSLTLPSAYAAPITEASFSDVPAGSWYEPGVQVCAEKGVMVGTGEGLFSPEKELTNAECLTLALRLYDLQKGGSGELLTAPQEWGTITLALSDGTVFQQGREHSPTFGYDHFMVRLQPDLYRFYVLAPGETVIEQRAWATVHEGPAELSVDGTRYEGWTEALSTDGQPCLVFLFDDSGLEEELELYYRIFAPLPEADDWCANAVYTAWQWKLSGFPGFDTMLLLGYTNLSAGRDTFAKALATAAGEVEKRYDVERIPDLEREKSTEDIYRFYEAGILSGLDNYGFFGARKNLTRAEAAVMVARVLEPTLRLSTPPAVPGAYEIAVAELRTNYTYNESSERTIETDYCTIFIHNYVGVMHPIFGALTMIYKPGCAVAEGTTIRLPVLQSGNYGAPPDTMDLNSDGKTFTYTYTFEAVSSGGQPGVYTFSVDLPTGKVSQSYMPFDT